MNVNQAAFCTIIPATLLTGGAAFVAATTASTVTAVALTILALVGASLSIATITSWVASQDHPDDVEAFFSKIPTHLGFAVAGTFEFASKVIVTSLIEGIAKGIGKNVERRIAGPDVTYKAV